MSSTRSRGFTMALLRWDINDLRRRKHLPLLVSSICLIGVVIVYAKSSGTSRKMLPRFQVVSQNAELNRKDSIVPSVYSENPSSTMPVQNKCEPVHRTVFLKTHKTGSTTTSAIFQRFGMKRNLTFLVPERRHILSEKDQFSTRHIGKPPSGSQWNFSVGYQMFTNHVRYNRAEMDKVFHGAKYITIIRNPVSQFESGFWYFEMQRYLPESKNPIELFMSDPIKYYNYVQQGYPGKEHRMHNMQLFDLGMNPVDMYRMDVIDNKIRQLDKEFSLVMINEYFEESLVLLRKLLCWSMDDITYSARCVRSSSYRKPLSEDLRSKISQWNSGDARLYDYFNRTFWDKVRNYDGDFEEDLAQFRQHQAVVDKCLNKSEPHQGGKNDDRTVGFSPAKDAPAWCQEYRFSDISASEKTRDRMRSLGIPQYELGTTIKKVVKSVVHKKVSEVKKRVEKKS